MNAAPDWRTVYSDPVLLAATGFGSGLVPRAPGTAGTVLAALVWVAAFTHLPWFAQGMLCVVAAVFGIWLCDRAVIKLGVDDHQSIVWDEFAGVWIALWLAGPGWPAVLLAVVLFRVLDIAKPWPVGAAERAWRGGAGVMADDLVAGVLAGGFTGIGMTVYGMVAR